MQGSWRPIGLGLSVLVGVGLWRAAPADGAPRACEQIKMACRDAGFVPGGMRRGDGVEDDCFKPIVEQTPQPGEATRPLPTVEPRLVAECRAASGLGEGASSPPGAAQRFEERRASDSSTISTNIRPPSGLVAVLTYHQGEALDLSPIDNVYIRGVALQIHWADIEGIEGKPDWSTLDALFARAQAKEKWVQLLIFPGFFAPEWADPRDDLQTFALQYGPGSRSGDVAPLPMPWNDKYLDDWLAFVKLVAERYGDNPAFKIMAADGPTSVSAEATEPNSAADRTLWKAKGYTQSKYVGAWKTVLKAYAADFPNQWVTIAGGAATDSIVDIDDKGNIVSNFHLGTKGQIDAEGMSDLGTRFGLQNSNLDGYKGVAKPGRAYVIGYAGKVLTGFQLRSSVSGRGMGVGAPADILKAALDNGVTANSSGAHVNYIEIYSKDVLNPKLQSTLSYGASLFP